VTRLRLDSAARAELLHETRYYGATRPGPGRRFREAVDEAFERIKRAPEAGKPDEEGCRRIRVAGFPFSVVYREDMVTLRRKGAYNQPTDCAPLKRWRRCCLPPASRL